MQVRELMTRPAKTVTPWASVEVAAAIMAIYGVGALPVCEAGRVVGILTDRDLAIRCIAGGKIPKKTQVRAIMTPQPVVVSPHVRARDAARMMADLGIRRLPVVQGGRAIGMITADDIARCLDDDVLALQMIRRLAPRARWEQATA